MNFLRCSRRGRAVVCEKGAVDEYIMCIRYIYLYSVDGSEGGGATTICSSSSSSSSRNGAYENGI